MWQAVFKEVASNFDLMHIMSVLAEGEPPTEQERKVLSFAKTAFGGPVAGPLAWQKVVEFASTKGWDETIMSYISDGALSGLTNVKKPKTLKDARAYIVDAIASILNRDPALSLSALIKCPACGYTHGVHS